MIGFDKSMAIGFIMGYFIVGIGFFPVERNGTFEHFVWAIVGLVGATVVGFISGVIKFINLRKSKYNIKTNKEQPKEELAPIDYGLEDY